MYLAELHGKLSRKLPAKSNEGLRLNYEVSEDILTSNVFGFLKYANRKIYLRNFLEISGLDVSDLSDEDLEKANFQFWPTYLDGTEPDVIITLGRYYILVEAKINAGFGVNLDHEKNQLNREYQNGKQSAADLKKEFILLTITGDSSIKLNKFEKTSQILKDPCFRWTNWQKFASLLKGILEPDDNVVPDQLIATDLLTLLERRNFREFRSFNKLDFKFRPVQIVFFDYKTAVFRGDFIGFNIALPQYSYTTRPSIFYTKMYFAGFSCQYDEEITQGNIFYHRKDRS